MRAGALREKIRIEKRGETIDRYRNPVPGWVPLDPAFEVRARIKPLGGTEQMRADRIEAPVRYEITIRRSARTAALDPTGYRAVNMRTNEIYDIHAIVDPTERRQWLVMTCTAGKADG